MNEPLVEIKNLKTWYPIKRGVFARTVGHVKAVDDITINIEKGETIGLVGESGCGKTTFGRTIIGLEKAASGSVLFKGKDLTTMNSADRKKCSQNIQMIFQDPFSSLNPRLTIMDIITEGLIEHNKIEKSIEADATRLLEEVGLNHEALYRYPHEFSGGQRQRIGVARAIGLKPDLIICDESVSALDVSVQAQVINLLMDLRDKYQLSYLFISHDLSVVRQISTKIAVMYLGKIVEFGPTKQIIENPQHPYTKALISAVPVPGKTIKDRVVLKGEIPSASNPPPGCRFHTRCPIATDNCKQEIPELENKGNTQVACFNTDND
ncbi:MAG: peptide ABC transporter substrate-binding protein [Planctomycetota bacterium]|nr:MAG: peptide ABC transporter substrate-binding protein [Planctomycetota bacterium]